MRTEPPGLIIGITGKMRAGKDTTASFIQYSMMYSMMNSTIMHFADPLKEIGMVFGFTKYQLYVDKDEINKVWNMSGRTWMQKFGTDLIRNHWGMDTWVRITSHRMDEALAIFPHVVVADVRFNDEAVMIIDRGGIIIDVRRNDYCSDQMHVSERGIDGSLIDVILSNDETKDALDGRIKKITSMYHEILSNRASSVLCINEYETDWHHRLGVQGFTDLAIGPDGNLRVARPGDAIAVKGCTQ